MRISVCITAVIVCAFTAQVFSQTNANLVTDSGSTVSARVDVEISTSSYGTLTGTDTDTTSATGNATITLLPTDGPYEDVILHDFFLELGTANFSYSWIFGIVTLDVTLTDMKMDVVEPASAPIGPGGSVVFEDILVHGTGTARVQVPLFGIDDTQPIDSVVEGEVSMTISADSRYVTIDQISIPPISQDVPPEELPDGVNAIHIDADIDATNTSFTGELWDGFYGDGNADGQVDLTDYALFADCMEGPEVAVSLICSLFDADEDLDVDLADFAVFQEAFATGID